MLYEAWIDRRVPPDNRIRLNVVLVRSNKVCEFKVRDFFFGEFGLDYYI